MRGSQSADTTVVVTSCNRHDLLARTLESFVRCNSDGGLARIIVVEDGAADPSAICRRVGAELIRTEARVGQIAAIDLAYAEVRTPYIFHLEDDWEFYRSGFIERSRYLLRSDPATVCVWLRAWNDTNGHPLAWHAPDRSLGLLAKRYAGVYSGFTFNPGLRRLSDYHRLGPYGRQKLVTPLWQRRPSLALAYEVEANIFYERLGYRAVILDEGGYVRHIGEGRHVTHPADGEAAAR